MEIMRESMTGDHKEGFVKVNIFLTCQNIQKIQKAIP